MADDIIPAIQGGGQQGAQRGNAGGVDYRQLQNPEQVRTDLPDSGAAARAAALAGVFKTFGGEASDISDTLETKAGALAGAASGNTGHPQYKQGLLQLTTFGRTFNNAATAAYAVQAEAQADDAAAKLRVEANKDPVAFETTFTAYRDAVIKNAPAMAVPMLTDKYNKLLAINKAAITGDYLTEQRELQGKTLTEGVTRQVSRVATLLSSSKATDQLAAQDEQVKLTMLIDGGVKSGLYSTAEAEAMHINSMRTITEQVFSTQVDSALADPNGHVVDLMERFRNAYLANQQNPNEPAFMSHPEYDRLMSEAKQKLQQQRQMEYYAKAEGKTAEQLKYEAGDKDMTSRLLSGTLTVGALNNGVINGDVTPEVARTLRNQILLGPVAHSDPKAVLAAQADPNHLDWTSDEIASLPGISNPDKIRLGQQFEKERRDWQGTPEAKQGVAAIQATLKIRPGTNRAMMSDDQRAQLDNALQEYTTRMNALDPAKRRTSALSTANDVTQVIQQKNIQSQISELQKLRADALAEFGGQWDKARMDTYLKQKDDAISALQKQLSK